ncbi:hypothetical protein [Fimbriiglobus ruber]|uniref:hypothetical protein n=1 Tax=Fimbriiglobus ruber TaxID=1908690 RepID=UPI000B4C0CD3|nr:hypothetical protein [Fimbriiglobus ruber]
MTPSLQDIANATRRTEIAGRQKAEYEQARTFVESVLGPGFVPISRHYLVDHDEEERSRRSGGRMASAATVITAEKDGVRRHVAVVGDETRECASYEEGFGAMLTEPDPMRGFTHKGQWCSVHRYSLYWAGYEPGYAPRTAEQLAAARVKREARGVEREAKGNLFGQIIREEGFVPKRRGR